MKKPDDGPQQVCRVLQAIDDWFKERGMETPKDHDKRNLIYSVFEAAGICTSSPCSQLMVRQAQAEKALNDAVNRCGATMDEAVKVFSERLKH